MEYAIGSFLIRAANAIVWSFVAYRIIQNDRPISRPARRLISVIVFTGFWLLTLGSLTSFGFDVPTTRLMYTSYTAIALMVGVVLAMEKGGP